MLKLRNVKRVERSLLYVVSFKMRSNHNSLYGKTKNNTKMKSLFLLQSLLLPECF